MGKSNSKSAFHKFPTYFIALVWLINGLFCKVLGLVPRHQEIVAQILGTEYAEILTKMIGFAEIGMAFWILTRYKSRLNSILQIVVILTMNLMETFLVPDLLLWGHLNLVFAILFIAVVYYNEFVLPKKVSVRN